MSQVNFWGVLIGGTRTFSFVLLCADFLRFIYELPLNIGHGFSKNLCIADCLNCHCQRLICTHSFRYSSTNYGVARDRQHTSSHSYRRYGIGAVAAFFLERWERERRKPVFSVLDNAYPTKRDFTISVRFFDGTTESESAHFHFVGVQNHGEDTALDVKPFIRILGVPDEDRVKGLLPVTIIPAYPIEPRMDVDWRGTKEEFASHKEGRFARALTHDQRILNAFPSLAGFGTAECFALVFGVKGSNRVYLATVPQIGMPMPCTFELALLFHGQDLRVYLSRVYSVIAKSWDSIEVKPVNDLAKISPHLRLGYLSFSKLS